MTSKSGADRFWLLLGVSAVLVAAGIAAALVIFAVAPNGLL
jgi:hypothetical protein